MPKRRMGPGARGCPGFLTENRRLISHLLKIFSRSVNCSGLRETIRPKENVIPRINISRIVAILAIPVGPTL